MPTAAKSAAPSTGKVQTKTVTTVVTDPVEQTLPPPLSAEPEPRDFWPYIETLNANPERWKTHKVTLYRYPLGQAKPQKLGRYVKTYKAENPLVSEDQIFDEFGGSQYDALLKGPGSDGNQTLLAKYSWEMDGPAKNPWATSTTTAGGVAPSDTAAILETLLKHVQNLQAAKNPAQDPAIKESIALIQQLTTAMPKAQGINELVAGLADLKKLTGDNGGGGSSLKEAITMLKDLGVIGGERKSLAQEIKDILEISGMITGGGGTGGGGKRDFATSLIENLPTILEKATPIADKFADAARNNARVAELRAGHTLPAAAAPAPSATRPAVLPAKAETPAATPAAEPPASRVVAAPETEPAVSPRIVVQPPSLDWVKARAVQLFASGKPGDAVAEWLDSIDDQLGNFLGSMDAEKFAAFVKEDPILSQIATAPRFEEFVGEFVDYFATDGAIDSTPAPEK